jgi:hypothetical protein
MSRPERSRSPKLQRALVGLVAFCMALVAVRASAEVRHTGTWPEHDKKVTLSVQRMPRSQAIRELAKKAGWSVVVRSPSDEPVEVAVKNQPADKVLDLLLADGHFVADRDGDLISIAPEAAAAPPAASAAPAGATSATATPPAPASSAASAPGAAAVPPAAAAPSAAPVASAASASESAAKKTKPTRRGHDRVVTGSSVRIDKSDIVHDLVVMGGSAEVFGQVTGDLVVIGGSARVHNGAHVYGDATTVGGSLTVDDGARVDGDAGVVGGNLHRKGDAKIGGKASQDKLNISVGSHGDHERGSWLTRALRDVGGAMTRAALLFVFGAVLFALATRRMESLELEATSRPMRSFALGVVGLLLGALAIVALCVTIVGIPLAIIGALLAVFAGYAGVCAVLTAVGSALVRHKSDNVYVHLAVGCALLLVLGSIPYLGGLVTVALLFTSVGVVVATRGAGIFNPKHGTPPPTPYGAAAA